MGARFIGAWLLVPVASALALVGAKQISEKSAFCTRAAPVTVHVISSAVENGHPQIRFRHSVEGSDYESSRVAALTWRGDEAAARELVERCPTGGGCLGFYDPQNPASAFLDLRGFPIAGHAMLLAAIALGTLAFLALSSKPKDLKPVMVWFVGGTTALFHYVAVSEQYDLFLGVGITAVLAGGAALLSRTLR